MTPGRAAHRGKLSSCGSRNSRSRPCVCACRRCSVSAAAAELVVAAAAGDSTADLEAARALAPVVRRDAHVRGPDRRARAASRRCPDGSAGDGQHRDRTHDRCRAAHGRLGGARMHPARGAVGAVSAQTSAGVHRRRRVRLDGVPARSGGALDARTRPGDDKHWLVWTSPPAPFKAGLRRIHREHGVERFPQPAQVQVDAADLDVAEKAKPGGTGTASGGSGRSATSSGRSTVPG